MLRFGLFAVPFLISVAAAVAAEAKPDVAKAVLAVEREWISAVLKQDKAALERLMADDIVYVHGDGNVESKAHFIEQMTNGTKQQLDGVFKNTKVRQYGDIVITEHLTLIKTPKVPAGEALEISLVWGKPSGQWQLLSRHASRLKPEKEKEVQASK